MVCTPYFPKPWRMSAEATPPSARAAQPLQQDVGLLSPDFFALDNLIHTQSNLFFSVFALLQWCDNTEDCDTEEAGVQK